MGLCFSNDPAASEQQQLAAQARQKSKELEKSLHSQDLEEQQINKLLLLGAGDSGKSTLFKQMKIIHGPGFSEKERRTYVSTICNNVILSIKTLVDQSAKYGTIANQQSKQVVSDLKEDTIIDAHLAKHILALWADASIQKAYDHRSLYQLTDSTQYYFDRLNVIAVPGYIPDDNDILRARVPTTGIIENIFEIDCNQFKIMDVGGQRSERKKWIHCFDGVTSVLFVAAMSSYDQFLYEDAETSQITEALALFEDIVNSEWFAETSVILFLNKKDLFAEKIKKVPLSTYFKEFKGSSYHESVDFIKALFRARNHNPNKDIYMHVTCATDKNQMQQVFNDVKDIIIKKVIKILM